MWMRRRMGEGIARPVARLDDAGDNISNYLTGNHQENKKPTTFAVCFLPVASQLNQVDQVSSPLLSSSVMTS